MQSFLKTTSLRHGEIILWLKMEVNHVLIMNFNVTNMSFNPIHENKILTKISEFTVVIHLCFYMVGGSDLQGESCMMMQKVLHLKCQGIYENQYEMKTEMLE